MKTQPLEFEKPIVELEEKLADLKRHSRAQDINFDPEVRRMEGKIEETETRYLRTSHRVAARADRPAHSALTRSIICHAFFTNFIELHGDRLFGEDRAMPGGLRDHR